MLLLCYLPAFAQGGHWQTDPYAYLDETVVYARVVNADGVDVEACEVAAFVGDECRAVAVRKAAPDGGSVLVLRVKGDDVADKGKTISFRLFDQLLSQEVALEETAVYTGQSVNVPSNPLLLHYTRIDHYDEITLDAGWTWVARSAASEENLSTIFGDNLIEIRTQDRESYNDPVYGLVGTIKDLRGISAYRVNIKEAQTISIPECTEMEWTITNGYNWIPYSLSKVHTVQEVLKDVPANDMDIIYSQDGKYLQCNNGVWSGDLLVFQPGHSYLYFVNVATHGIHYNITFRDNGESVSATAEDDAYSYPSGGVFGRPIDPKQRADASVVFVTLVDRDGKPLAYEKAGMLKIGAFVGDEFRNECDVLPLTTDGGAYVYPMMVYGDSSDEGMPIDFQLFDPVINLFYWLQGTAEYRNGQTVGTMPSEPLTFKFVPVETITPNNCEFTIPVHKPYPIPLEITPADATPLAIDWDYQPSILSVGNDLTVMGLQPTTPGYPAYLTGTVGWYWFSYQVNVVQPVESISINPDLPTVIPTGDYVVLDDYVIFNPENATDKSITVEVLEGGEGIKFDHANGPWLMMSTTDDEVTLVIKSVDNPEATDTITFTFESYAADFTFKGVEFENEDNQLSVFVGDDDLTVGIESVPAEQELLFERFSLANEADNVATFQLFDDFKGIYVAISPVSPGITTCEVRMHHGNGDVVKQIKVRVGQKMLLLDGWNWISTNHCATYADGWNIQAALGNNLLQLRSENQVMTNDAVRGYFGDVLDNFYDVTNGGARIKLRDAQTLKFFGEAATEAQFSFHKGWNWFGYPFAQDYNIEDLLYFADASEGDIIKSQDEGFAQYVRGEWEGTLTRFRAGQSYAYFAKKAVDVQLKAFESSRHLSKSVETPQKVASRHYDNMAITATIDDFDAASCYALRAYINNECCGEGAFINGKWYITAYAAPDERITFKLVCDDSGESLDLEGEYAFTSVLGSAEAPLALRLCDVATDDGDSAAERVFTSAGIEVTSQPLTTGVYVMKMKNGKMKKVVIK